MYSILLMAAMTSPIDVNQYIFSHRVRDAIQEAVHHTGCSGAHAVARTKVKERIREVVHGQPVRGFFHAVMSNHRERVSARGGCAGGVSAVRGCSGGTVAYAVPAPAEATVARPHLLERAAVNRMLKIALDSDKVTLDQAKYARRALDDPDVYKTLVVKVHRGLLKNPSVTGHVGAIGDGHLLKILIDSMPQIIAAIKEIIALFGFLPAQPRQVPGYSPMPVGPYAPGVVVPRRAVVMGQGVPVLVA